MGYSGVTANCINAVQAALSAAATAATIAVDPALVTMAAAGVQNQLPNVVVSLPSVPFEAIQWGGTSNLKNDDFTVEVWTNAQIEPSSAVAGGHPYGDDTTPGLLTVHSQVEDALENAYAALLAADGHVVDVSLMAAMYFRKTDGSSISALTRVVFKLRYYAGNRG